MKGVIGEGWDNFIITESKQVAGGFHATRRPIRAARRRRDLHLPSRLMNPTHGASRAKLCSRAHSLLQEGAPAAQDPFSPDKIGVYLSVLLLE